MGKNVNGNGNRESDHGKAKDVPVLECMRLREDAIKSAKDRYRNIDGIMKNDAWSNHIPVEDYDPAWVLYYKAMVDVYEHDFIDTEEHINQAIIKANEVVYENVRRALVDNQDKMPQTRYKEFYQQLEDLYSLLCEGNPTKTNFGDPLAAIFHGIFKEVKEYERIAEALKKKQEELKKRLSNLNQTIAGWPEGPQADTLTQMFQMVKNAIKGDNAHVGEDEVQIKSLEETLEMFEKLRESQAEELKALETKSAEIGGN